MKKWLVAVLFGTLLVLGACGGDSNDNAGDNGNNDGNNNNAGESVAAGEDVFRDNCASCHGADLSGASAPELTNIGSSLSADEILDIVENGQGGMPPGMASGQDAVDVADWLADHK